VAKIVSANGLKEMIFKTNFFVPGFYIIMEHMLHRTCLCRQAGSCTFVLYAATTDSIFILVFTS
jgi:hypothetical protein